MERDYLELAADVLRGRMSTLDYMVGRRYRKERGDYVFEGECVAVFLKKSGAVRVVLEDARGLLFIFSLNQIVNVEETAK